MATRRINDHHERADLYRELLCAARSLDDHFLNNMIVKRIKQLTAGIDCHPNVIPFPCYAVFQKKLRFWKQKEFWTTLAPLLIGGILLVLGIASVTPFLKC